MKLSDMSSTAQTVLSAMSKYTNRAPAQYIATDLGIGFSTAFDALSALSTNGLVSRKIGQGWKLTDAGRALLKPVGTWVVYQHDITGPVDVLSFISEQDALTHATKMTSRHSQQYYVAKLVARVKPVTNPTFEIERV